jgi:hypothetical protein
MKNNKMIAEFMGYHRDDEVVIVNLQSYLYLQCKFDTSFDWIIPVVRKCKETNELAYNGSNIKSALLSLDVQNVFNAVVEFIEYYNDVTNRPFIPNLQYKDGFGNWHDYTEELQKNKCFNPFKTREKI